MAWAEPYLHTKWNHDTSDPVATIDTCQKWGAVPLLVGSWVPFYSNVAWAETYLHTKWHPDTSDHLARIGYTNVTDRKEQR